MGDFNHSDWVFKNFVPPRTHLFSVALDVPLIDIPPFRGHCTYKSDFGVIDRPKTVIFY